MNVYVLKKDQKSSKDNLYHHYYTEEDRFKGGLTEHFERENPDGTFTVVGDYMVGEALFPRALTKEVKPHECSLGVAFRDHNMVARVPSGNDHVEGGVEYVEFVVDNPLEVGKPVHIPDNELPESLRSGKCVEVSNG